MNNVDNDPDQARLAAIRAIDFDADKARQNTLDAQARKVVRDLGLSAVPTWYSNWQNSVAQTLDNETATD